MDIDPPNWGRGLVITVALGLAGTTGKAFIEYGKDIAALQESTSGIERLETKIDRLTDDVSRLSGDVRVISDRLDRENPE